MRTIVALCLLPVFVDAQDKAILPDEPPPHKMLHAFLLKEAQKHFDARRDLVAKLKTPEEIKARQDALKKKFFEAIGDLPEKTPLNAKVVRTIKADGFRVENVIFESRPEHHVTANLYVPDGAGPFPGILIPCGHSANGKAIDAYQRVAILMAKNGMVALCYDPIGQGERIQLLDKTGKAGVSGMTNEHTMVGVGALLVGRCTANYRIWDGIRALDYLGSRPEVDAKRLGCTGNSGGGTVTAYLMALDERIACAAPSCYITSLERLFATIGPQDAEQNIPGQVAFGLEHADFLTLRAPRPTLMTVATRDFFDVKGAWTSYLEASAIYKKLGAAEKMAIFEYDDTHGWSKPRREASMRWMRKWLQGKDDMPVETDFTHFKDADLQCTRSGQVLEDFRGVSVFDLNAQRDKELAKERARFVAKERKEQETIVRSLLGLPTKPAAPDFKVSGEGKVVRYIVLAFDSEPDLKLELFLFEEPKEAKGKQGVVLIEDEEGQAHKGAGVFVDKVDFLIRAGLRGLGRYAPGKTKGGKAGYFGVDVKEAFLAMHVDRPLTGARVLDLQNALKLKKDAKHHLDADGPASALAALHAAALDPSIASVTLENCLLSWSNVVQTPVSYNQLTNVVPGVLKHYDLPELAAMIAPRPLVIRNAVDAQGTPVSQKVLEETYRVTRERYEALKAGKNFVLEGAK
jgi:dienelactone hydrolase